MSEKAAQVGRAGALIVAGVVIFMPALVVVLLAIAAALIGAGLLRSDRLSDHRRRRRHHRAGPDRDRHQPTVRRRVEARRDPGPVAARQDRRQGDGSMSMNSVYQNAGSDFVHNLGDAARRNPVSTALIGMGVLWLITRRQAGRRRVATCQARLRPVARRRQGLDRGWREVGASAASARWAIGLSDVRGSAGDVLDSATSKARETGAAALQRARRLTSEATDVASDFARGLPSRSADLFDSARVASQPDAGRTALAARRGGAGDRRRHRRVVALDPDRSRVFRRDRRRSEIAGGRLRRPADRAASRHGGSGLGCGERRSGRQGFSPDSVRAAASAVGDKVAQAAATVGAKLKSAE